MLSHRKPNESGPAERRIPKWIPADQAGCLAPDTWTTVPARTILLTVAGVLERQAGGRGIGGARLSRGPRGGDAPKFSAIDSRGHER
jgi:hypothetical protein